MSTTTWADMASAIAMDAPDCPRFTLEAELRRAAEDFYRDTRAWRSDHQSLAVTVVGQSDYTVVNAEGSALVGLPAVWIDGIEVDESPIGSGDDVASGETGPAEGVSVVDATTIRVVPAPMAAALAIVATIALGPSADATGIPSRLYQEHRRSIEAAALASVLRMPGKPWSNPAEAAARDEASKRLALLASTYAGPRRRRAALRVRPL